MASSPSPKPSPTVVVPPPLATPQSPSSMSPIQFQPNASSPPPLPSNSSNLSPSSPPQLPPSTPSVPPPVAPSPPPPLLPTSPPPASPPIPSPPSPSLPSSPPSSPPPHLRSPPPTQRSPPLVLSPPPPVSALPPPPTLSPPQAPPPRVSAPPPPRRSPPQIRSPPPQVSASPPPPAPIVSPPPPSIVSPSPPLVSPPPVVYSPPPPANSPPPSESSPPPPSNSRPPSEKSPPPPSLLSPAPSGPKLAPPPPPNSRLNPSPPPPSNRPQPMFPPPPSNSSASVTPVTPPSSSSPVPPQNLSPPVSPPNVNTGFGNSTSSGSNGFNTGSAVAIGAIVGVVVLSLIGIVVWCVRKKNKRVAGFSNGYTMPTLLGSSEKSDTSNSKPPSSAPLLGNGSSCSGFPYSPPEPGVLGNSRSCFTYEELLEVTNGFSEHNLLGEGGFGSVYKGRLPDGREVAVKQLKIGGSQGEREFSAEVEIISRVHHRHLVSLVGYCISEHQRLLIYDYVPNNTLYYHLHGERIPVMDWATRLKVAAGAARGIAYLHEDCHPRIIHRDIKSSNILLDNNFEAQVSDFGLAKLALDSFTHVSTRVMGTFGYLAPEYASSGKLTDKSDVYSFGVVLLELITGRKPVDASQPLGDESVVEWVRPLLTHALDNEDFEGLVDPRLEKNYVGKEMFRMIEAAAACVRHSAAKRPRMGQIVRALELIDRSDLNNGMKPGQSKLFDSAQQSEEIRLFQRMAFGSQDYRSDFSETGWRDEREL